MEGLLVGAVLFGGIYGFALYVRDIVRYFRRYQATGQWSFWPNPMTWDEHDENVQHHETPRRPDEDRWWER